RSIIRIDYRAKRFDSYRRMVPEMHNRARRVRVDSTEPDLQRRQLSARIVRILGDRDAGVARNRGTHALAMRSDHNHEPRHHCEHRLRNLLDKGPPANLE